jgi:hypothetical protein
VLSSLNQISPSNSEFNVELAIQISPSNLYSCHQTISKIKNRPADTNIRISDTNIRISRFHFLVIFDCMKSPFMYQFDWTNLKDKTIFKMTSPLPYNNLAIKIIEMYQHMDTVFMLSCYGRDFTFIYFHLHIILWFKIDTLRNITALNKLIISLFEFLQSLH